MNNLINAGSDTLKLTIDVPGQTIDDAMNPGLEDALPEIDGQSELQPGLQGVVGRVPSRGVTSDAGYSRSSPMKKVALVFVLAVFVPSLVLAWLAVRSLRDQQFVLERQRSLLCQGVADSVAKEAANLLA